MSEKSPRRGGVSAQARRRGTAARQLHNDLVRSSSPAGSTTHSRSNGDFPEPRDSPRIGGVAWRDFVSAPASLNLQGRFGLFVSALKIPFPGNRDFGSKRRGSTEVGSRPCPCRSRAGRRNLSRHEIARGECRCGHIMERPSLYVSENVL